MLTDTQSVMWDASTVNNHGLHTAEVPSPTLTSNSGLLPTVTIEELNQSTNTAILPHSAYYGLGLGVLLLLVLVLAAIIVALVFILKKRQRYDDMCKSIVKETVFYIYLVVFRFSPCYIIYAIILCMQIH